MYFQFHIRPRIYRTLGGLLRETVPLFMKRRCDRTLRTAARCLWSFGSRRASTAPSRPSTPFAAALTSGPQCSPLASPPARLAQGGPVILRCH
jgi:hypothetical protein